MAIGATKVSALESPSAWDDLETAMIPLAGITDLADVAGADLGERLAAAGTSGFMQVADEASAFLVAESAEAAVPAAELISSFLGAIDAAPGPRAKADAHAIHRLESRSGTHLVAQQTVEGVAVLGGRFVVHKTEENAYAVTGRPAAHIAVAPKEAAPKRFPHQRVKRAVREMFDLSPDHEVRTERTLVPLPNGDGIWALKAGTILREPAFADMRVIMSVNDLAPLLTYNVASATLYGEGLVYPINPLRSPKRTGVRIDALGPAFTDRLSGTGIAVSSPGPTSYINALRDFRIDDTDPSSDEVAAYYHISRAIRFFSATLGQLFKAIPFTPVRAVVHDADNPGNAIYAPSTGELRFGDLQGRATARSAEIVYHELSHAISDAICRLGRGLKDTQARGLSEGYSDYFAATILDNPIIGDYLVNKKEGVRDGSKTSLRFAPDFAGREHATGEVWSAVLWGLRQETGAEVTDVLATESLYFLDSGSTFNDGQAALLAADQRLFPASSGDGRHADAIKKAYSARVS